MPETKDTLVRPFDVAVLLGVSTQTVINKASKGTLPGAVYIDKTLRFDIEKVRAFIRDGGRRTEQPSTPRRRAAVNRIATPDLAAEDSRTTRKIGRAFEHRWDRGDIENEHPYSPTNKKLVH